MVNVELDTKDFEIRIVMSMLRPVDHVELLLAWVEEHSVARPSSVQLRLALAHVCLDVWRAGAGLEFLGHVQVVCVRDLLVTACVHCMST